MLFNSAEFLLFFPIVTIIYFLLPHKFRWIHLLIASCFFYMFFIPVYIFILIFTIIIDYIAGIMIENAAEERKKPYLIMSLVANIGVLAFFKYYNFFISNLDQAFGNLHLNTNIPLLGIVLPIGLSFHTFQAMSYTIEVFRGNQKAERHFGIYSLYVMFYPQLVAGPIERPQNVLPQMHEQKNFSYDNLVSGLRLMLWGMVKKVVIADRLSTITDPIFNSPASYSGIALAIGAFFFAFQIFCDFSGYSDIALGSARVMGFHLMTNFNKPYHSRTISEFWKRWHISLSTWFRDYLYISLGGNRVKVSRNYFNLFFVFLVSGFWHGANWTFIIWGALHGFYCVFALITLGLRKRVLDITGISKSVRLGNILDVCITFLLVTYAWIFFRANNLNDALFITKKLGNIPAELKMVFMQHKIGFLNLPGLNILRNGLLCVVFLEVVHLLSLKYDLLHNFHERHWIFRWSVYYAGIMLLFFCGVFENIQFIYFQF